MPAIESLDHPIRYRADVLLMHTCLVGLIVEHNKRGLTVDLPEAVQVYLRPAIGKISVGDKQLCLKPGMYYLRGVFFHVLSRRDVARGPPLWVSWDDWFLDHELPLE